MAQWLGRRISDQGVPGSSPCRCTFRCGLEQVTFTLLSTGRTQEAVLGRPTWTDCDEAGDYVVPNALSPRDLVFRPDNMDEPVPHDIKNCKSSDQVYMRSWYGLCHCLFKVMKVFTDRLGHQSTTASTQP